MTDCRRLRARRRIVLERTSRTASPNSAASRVRDWLARLALIGLAGSHYKHLTPQSDIADDCYTQSDTMLAERELFDGTS